MALLRGRSPNPWPARTGWGVGRGSGLLRRLLRQRKDEEEERTKKLEDLGLYVMLMAEAHGLLMLGKPAWTAEQRARFRVLSTQITSKEASASSGRRKRKRKRRKKKLPRTSSFAHAARNLKSGVFSTGPLYLTVLCLDSGPIVDTCSYVSLRALGISLVFYMMVIKKIGSWFLVICLV